MSAQIDSIHGHRSAVDQTIRRRSTVGYIVTVLLAILLAPLAAEAQAPSTIPRVAYLALAPGPWATPSEALVQGLRELGYVEGQNIVIEYRWSAGSIDRLREHAAELVRLGVDVIVTGGPLAIRGQDPERRRTGRPARGTAHSVRTADQPRGRQSPRDHDSPGDSPPGGRGD